MATEPACVLRVRVTPRCARAGVTRVDDGVVFVRVTAPPVEGAANRAVVELLAEAVGVRRSAVTVKSGAAARTKTVAVEGVTAADAIARLVAAAQSA